MYFAFKKEKKTFLEISNPIQRSQIIIMLICNKQILYWVQCSDAGVWFPNLSLFVNLLLGCPCDSYLLCSHFSLRVSKIIHVKSAKDCFGSAFCTYQSVAGFPIAMGPLVRQQTRTETCSRSSYSYHTNQKARRERQDRIPLNNTSQKLHFLHRPYFLNLLLLSSIHGVKGTCLTQVFFYSFLFIY